MVSSSELAGAGTLTMMFNLSYRVSQLPGEVSSSLLKVVLESQLVFQSNDFVPFFF